MKEYLTFRKFSSTEEAQAVYHLLQEHGIPCEIDTTPLLLSTAIVGQIQQTDIALKMPADKFAAADKIILDNTTIEAPDADYYLLSFSDAALREVIEKKDEWGDYDYALALELLEKRGIGLSEDDIKQLQLQRVTRLSIPHRGQTGWVIAGYISAFFGGFFGIMLGTVFINFTKTLPDGSRMHYFTKGTQFHGRIIRAFGIAMFFAWIYDISNGGAAYNFLVVSWLLEAGHHVYGF